jgi:hypothetical protein
LSAAALLAACATAAPPEQAAAPSAPAPAAAPAPPISRAARLLAAAGRPDAPTRSEIERVLGPADIVRQEGAGAALTYRLDNCALLLLFAADGRSVMRLAQASAGARHAGAAAPSLDQCAAEASARRS